MEDNPNEDDPITNPQLTENFFTGYESIIHLVSTNKKFNNIFARALTNTKAYESYVNKFKYFLSHFTSLSLRNATFTARMRSG